MHRIDLPTVLLTSVLIAAWPPIAAGAPAAMIGQAPGTPPAEAAPIDTTPYRFQTVEGAGGVPLNVVTVGDPSRPAILFIHGTAQSYLSFERQLRSDLAERYFLVSFDLRGHGNSGKPWGPEAYSDRVIWGDDVDRVVKALRLHRPLVVGWSYGSLVAVDYLRYAGADAVAGIEFVGALGGLSPPPATPIPGAAEFARNRQRQLSPAIDQNYAAALFTTRSLTARPMPDDWTARTAAVAMMLPAAARGGMVRRPFDNRDLLPRLMDTPFLLNVGGHDVGLHEADARDLARELPGATVSVYESSGHSPFVEDPERFNRELGEFAARVFGRR